MPVSHKRKSMKKNSKSSKSRKTSKHSRKNMRKMRGGSGNSGTGSAYNLAGQLNSKISITKAQTVEEAVAAAVKAQHEREAQESKKRTNAALMKKFEIKRSKLKPEIKWIPNNNNSRLEREANLAAQREATKKNTTRNFTKKPRLELPEKEWN